MNIYKQFFVVVAACVAVVNTSACTTPPAPTPAPPSRYDEWPYWSTGKAASELTRAEPLLGLTGIEVPKKEYADLGYIGAARLESQCIVSFLKDMADKAQGTLSVVIFSRYNLKLTAVQKHLQLNEAKSFIQSYRSRCTEDSGGQTA